MQIEQAHSLSQLAIAFYILSFCAVTNESDREKRHVQRLFPIITFSNVGTVFAS
jgi:hypothetical protein